MSHRQIFKHNWHSQADVRDCLQAVFVAELLAPSRAIWVVSPWISDIPVIDNRGGNFDSVLDATWGQRQVRLTEVLARLAMLGTALQISTRPDAHNRTFLHRLTDRVVGEQARNRLILHESDELHEKGILSERFHLGGSMNLTYRGVLLLEEAVQYTTDPEALALAHLAYRERWGGPLAGAPT